MKLDELLEESILVACQEQNLGKVGLAVTKFVGHYLSNEIPEAEMSSKLQDIYQLIKEVDGAS